MAIDLKQTSANDLLDRYDTIFPATAILEIRSGAVPGAENAATGTLLASITLPATPWAAAASGSKAKSGTWSDTSADATGTAGHYRLKNAADTHREEGTITVTGGGGDMTLDSVSITAAQVVTVTTFTRTL